jgi:predicted nuclease of predicted toxin-antitoxin system
VRILADESVASQIIEGLRRDGHTVDAVAELSPSIDDMPILARATQYDVLLITEDLDFGGYIYKDKRPAPKAGVVQCRLRGLSGSHKADIVGAAFAQYASQFTGNFTVITEKRIKLRALP